MMEGGNCKISVLEELGVKHSVGVKSITIIVASKNFTAQIALQSFELQKDAQCGMSTR